MSKPTPDANVSVRRIDRILAFMSLGLLGLSLLCIIAILIGSSAGAKMNTGLWPTVGLVLYVAPVVGFVLLIVVLIMNFARRARANRGR